MKIVQLRVLYSIKPGPQSTILADGTIVNPIPATVVDVFLDDGTTVQIEGDPALLTVAKVKAAAAEQSKPLVGGVSVGDVV